MRLKRRHVDLYRDLTFIDIDAANRRRGLLENAVINYSGGLLNLECRVREVLSLRDELSHETWSLLCDISVYLRDIKNTHS